MALVLSSMVSAASAFGVWGILLPDTGTVSVDSVLWVLDNAPFPVWERTPDWMGESLVADTNQFHTPQTWPLRVTLYYSRPAGSMPGTHGARSVEPLVRDTWYLLDSAGGVITPGVPMVRFLDTLVHVGVESPAATPRARGLTASPSHFRGRAEVAFDLKQDGLATLVVYDERGRLVDVVFTGRTGAGSHSATWDGTDCTGRPVPAGVYFARLSALTETGVARLVKLR